MLPSGHHVIAALIFAHPLVAAQSVIAPVISLSLVPTFFDGGSYWALLGCYNETDVKSTGNVLSDNGPNFTPPFAAPDTVTVPLCLTGCKAPSEPANGSPVRYACAENSRYVLPALENIGSILFSPDLVDQVIGTAIAALSYRIIPNLKTRHTALYHLLVIPVHPAEARDTLYSTNFDLSLI